MEIWKEVKGYEFYQVSNLGRVKSLERLSNHSNGISKIKLKEKILKPQKDSNGYLFVRLYRNNKYKSYSVHKLVLICFLDYIKNTKLVIDHIDNNKLNNNLSNLQLITNRENCVKDRKRKSNQKNIYINKHNKYYIKIQFNKKTINVGGIKSLDEAIIKRDEILKEIINHA